MRGRAGSREGMLATCLLLSTYLCMWMATLRRDHHLAAGHFFSRQASDVSVASMFFCRSISHVLPLLPWWFIKIMDTYLSKAGGRYFILIIRAAALLWAGTMCRAQYFGSGALFKVYMAVESFIANQCLSLQLAKQAARFRLSLHLYNHKATRCQDFISAMLHTR